MINNASLTPKWYPGEQTQLENGQPDWIKTLIMAQFRIETVSETGDFIGAMKALDHFAEMGVNGLWINPVYERSEAVRNSTNNGYSGFETYKIDRKIAGTTDKDEGFTAARRFVEEAHKRNLRIFFDIVAWGVDKGSPIFDMHRDWFLDANGQPREAWGGWAYNWSNTASTLREWYIQNAVDIVVKTGIDGFRCDLEPDITGYEMWAEVRRRLYALGHKIAIINEMQGYHDDGTYDFDQVSVGWEKEIDWQTDTEFWFESGDYFLRNNIVDSIKTGKGIGKPQLQIDGKGGQYRYYTYNVCCHDSFHPHVKGNRIILGYQAIFAPFIPMWYVGEEWNNPHQSLQYGSVMFFNKIDWDAMEQPENKEFYEDIKKYIRIRRSYPELFEIFSDSLRNTNICKVPSNSTLQSYARYGGGKAIIILPNHSEEEMLLTAELPLEEAGLEKGTHYMLTELMTEEHSTLHDNRFSLSIKAKHLGVVLVSPAERG